MADQKAVLPDTPELERQAAIIKSGKAEVIQDFIDWFSEQGLHLTKFESRTFFEPCPGYGLKECTDGRLQKGTHKERECPKCSGTGTVVEERDGHYDDPRSPGSLMADFFGIDESKIESERRALLAAIREQN